MNKKLTSQNFKIKYTISTKMVDLIWKISDQISKLSNLNEFKYYPIIKKNNRSISIYSSLHIENNTLSYDQIVDIINDKKVVGPELDILAAQNAKYAYEMLDEIKYDSVDDLLRVHSTMMYKLVDKVGCFRNQSVYIGDKTNHGYKIIYKAPDANEVPGLVNQLFYWLKNDKAPIILKSCIFHYYLACIHPFLDGNGRTARLWQTAILSTQNPLFKWIPVEQAIFNKRDQYYDILKQSDETYDCTNFIEFILTCLYESILDVIRQTITNNSSLPNHILKMLSVIGKDHLTSSQIMKKLKLKSKSGFIKNYLKPALSAGVIGMTMPDKPTNKNQRYYKK